MSGIKVPLPSKWDGAPDIDDYDAWVFDVNSWQKLNGLTDEFALRMIPRSLVGKPKEFFMRHVADEVDKWSMKRLFEALFHYCFPMDYKKKLRTQLAEVPCALGTESHDSHCAETSPCPVGIAEDRTSSLGKSSMRAWQGPLATASPLQEA